VARCCARVRSEGLRVGARAIKSRGAGSEGQKQWGDVAGEMVRCWCCGGGASTRMADVWPFQNGTIDQAADTCACETALDDEDAGSATINAACRLRFT